MITTRVLNRTLLERQLLLRRTADPALEVIRGLVGLQAQNVLPPYLGLWSRIRHFEPAELSRLLEEREAVRMMVMRGTIHLVSAADCLELRPLMQEALTKVIKSADWGKQLQDLDYRKVASAARTALSSGPLTPKALGEAMAQRFPGHRPQGLAQAAVMLLPLVQIPPRGKWKRSAGQLYQTAEAWLGSAMSSQPDMKEVVRRYLRAFGPASAADINTWCRVTGIAGVLDSIRDELVILRTDAGRRLVDLEGLTLADPDQPAPVRFLGEYDNVFLSHADRTRIVDDAHRQRWMGRTGGPWHSLLVDGRVEGSWRVVDGEVEVEPVRKFTKSERLAIDDERERVEEFLAS
ncbi:MAG: winged helix DNA-binding domain-containing protein [Actinomycetota bacterium]